MNSSSVLEPTCSENETKRGRWSAEEDAKLRAAVEELGNRHWRAVSERVPGRSQIQCLHRWNAILKPGLVKGPWSTTEDRLLTEWVKANGPTKWTQCSEQIPGRTGKQCRERWFNALDPDVKKGEWLLSEDKLIFRLYHKFGPKWSEMAKHLPGRTENSIKNRFYSTIRKAKNRSQKYASDESAAELDPPLPARPAGKSVTGQVSTLIHQMDTLETLLGRSLQQVMFLQSKFPTR